MSNRSSSPALTAHTGDTFGNWFRRRQMNPARPLSVFYCQCPHLPLCIGLVLSVLWFSLLDTDGESKRQFVCHCWLPTWLKWPIVSKWGSSVAYQEKESGEIEGAQLKGKQKNPRRCCTITGSEQKWCLSQAHTPHSFTQSGLSVLVGTVVFCLTRH